MFKNLSVVILIIVSLLILICLIIVAPFLVIWSLNTLFGLVIPYTFQTWAASLFLSSVVSGGLVSRSK